MEIPTLQGKIVEKDTKIDPKWVSEITRLYDEGFCKCEPYWETDLEGAVTTELAEIAKDSNSLILTLPRGDSLSGFLIATSMDPERFEDSLNKDVLQKITKDDLYLLELVVDKRFRKKGIGSKMVKKAIDIARKAGKNGVTLRADLRNSPAMRLYQKLGFSLLTENKSSNPFDIYIRKDLSGPESNENQTLRTKCVQLLFKDYPPEEYLFFVDPSEIEGWRIATYSKRAVSRLGFDSKNWVQFSLQGTERLSKTVWVTNKSEEK